MEWMVKEGHKVRCAGRWCNGKPRGNDEKKQAQACVWLSSGLSLSFFYWVVLMLVVVVVDFFLLCV